MKVSLVRLEKVHLEGSNEANLKVSIDGSPEIGGEDAGMRPMELLLCSLGGCASMDVLHILSKGKHRVDSFELEIEGQRTDSLPSVFKRIDLLFRVGSGCPEKTLARAIELGVEKYCSVRSMFNDRVSIRHRYELRSP